MAAPFFACAWVRKPRSAVGRADVVRAPAPLSVAVVADG